GTTDLQAGAGAITLNAANTFTGAVTAGASGISMTDTATLTPGTISAGAGVVNLTAAGFSTTGSVQGGSGTLSSATQVGGSGTSPRRNRRVAAGLLRGERGGHGLQITEGGQGRLGTLAAPRFFWRPGTITRKGGRRVNGGAGQRGVCAVRRRERQHQALRDGG